MSRFVFPQWAHLAGELAPRGVDLAAVVVADDENLDLAAEHGFATVEMPNQYGIGHKLNAGYRAAAAHGADWIVHTGSDDWIHPDVLAPLADQPAKHRTLPIFAGKRIAIVSLHTGRLQLCVTRGHRGVIPWVIPRQQLERAAFAPFTPHKSRGLDGDLVMGLRRSRVKPQWELRDPHDVARVDFKSDTNLNSYQAVSGLARGAEVEAWGALARRYPADLVEAARRAHLEVAR